MEFPYFCGQNPGGWLLKFDQLFLINSVPEVCKVPLVQRYLKGRAEFWFSLQSWRGQISWDTFAELIIDQFGSYRFRNNEYGVTEISEVWVAKHLEFDQSEVSKTSQEEQVDELDEIRMAIEEDAAAEDIPPEINGAGIPYEMLDMEMVSVTIEGSLEAKVAASDDDETKTVTIPIPASFGKNSLNYFDCWKESAYEVKEYVFGFDSSCGTLDCLYDLDHELMTTSDVNRECVTADEFQNAVFDGGGRMNIVEIMVIDDDSEDEQLMMAASKPVGILGEEQEADSISFEASSGKHFLYNYCLESSIDYVSRNEVNPPGLHYESCDEVKVIVRDSVLRDEGPEFVNMCAGKLEWQFIDSNARMEFLSDDKHDTIRINGSWVKRGTSFKGGTSISTQQLIKVEFADFMIMHGVVVSWDKGDQMINYMPEILVVFNSPFSKFHYKYNIEFEVIILAMFAGDYVILENKQSVANWKGVEWVKVVTGFKGGTRNSVMKLTVEWVNVHKFCCVEMFTAFKGGSKFLYELFSGNYEFRNIGARMNWFPTWSAAAEIRNQKKGRVFLSLLNYDSYGSGNWHLTKMCEYFEWVRKATLFKGGTDTFVIRLVLNGVDPRSCVADCDMLGNSLLLLVIGLVGVAIKSETVEISDYKDVLISLGPSYVLECFQKVAVGRMIDNAIQMEMVLRGSCVWNSKDFNGETLQFGSQAAHCHTTLLVAYGIRISIKIVDVHLGTALLMSILGSDHLGSYEEILFAGKLIPPRSWIENCYLSNLPNYEYKASVDSVVVGDVYAWSTDKGLRQYGEFRNHFVKDFLNSKLHQIVKFTIFSYFGAIIFAIVDFEVCNTDVSSSMSSAAEGCAQFDNNHLQLMAWEVLQNACRTCNEDCWQDGNACCPILKFFGDTQKKNKGNGIGGLNSCWSLLAFSDPYLSCAVANHSLKYFLKLKELKNFVEQDVFHGEFKKWNMSLIIHLGDKKFPKFWDKLVTSFKGGTGRID